MVISPTKVGVLFETFLIFQKWNVDAGVAQSSSYYWWPWCPKDSSADLHILGLLFKNKKYSKKEKKET